MTKIEAILKQTNDLSVDELEQLLQALSAQIASEDEAAVARRGLAAFTESTKSEDWSMFYPEDLRNGGSPWS